MSDEAVLRLEAIERRYGRGETTIDVLHGVELSLKAGESVALIAPSGAGKSTLLHIAGLLERPDAGEVHVGGHADLGDERRGPHRAAPLGDRLRLSVPSPAAGILGAGERRPAADDRRPEARRSGGAGARAAGLPRPRRAREPSPGRALGRRAAARRPRPRASPTRRAFCSPTSRPATSTPRPPITSSTR